MTILSNGSQNTVNKGHTPNVPPHNKPGGPPGFRDCPSVSDYPLPPAVRRTKYRGARTNPWDPIGSKACAVLIIQLTHHDVNRPRFVRHTQQFGSSENNSTGKDPAQKKLAL